jgi:hypothetical protein
VSDESEELIEDVFVRKVGAKYPFVRAKGVNQTYEVRYFPSTYVIGPDGKILTVPDDRLPDEEFLEEHLADVSLAPDMPADARYDALRSMWDKQEHKRLADHLAKELAQADLEASVRTVLEAQRAELDARSRSTLERVAQLGRGPDYLRSRVRLERIARAWKGLPPAESAKKELDRFAKDAKIKKEMRALEVLHKLLASLDPSRTSQRKRLIEELEKFAQRYPNTNAAALANERLEKLGAR